MKKYTILFLLLSGIAVLAQTTYVPDDNFEQALIDFGYDIEPLDDYVPTANIENIEFLIIPYKDISDLTGIEDFMALTDLYCQFNQIAVLDLSQNLNLEVLHCQENQLSSLNVTGNGNLEWLACNDNQLSVLDTSMNSSLVVLSCQNNELTTLDFSANTFLEYLICYSNDLSNLNVTGLFNLQELICQTNQLTNLDTSSNTNLEEINCRNNQLTSLDVSSCTNLDLLYCDHNQLNYLNVSSNPNLQILNCSYNQLPNLNLSTATNLWHLVCWVNQMSSLDVSGCVNLEYIYCNSNQLTNLNLSTNINLKELQCTSNYDLTSIDVRNGNNANFIVFKANYNPSLSCIFVDDKEASYLDDWEIDTTASFVETQAECDALGTDNIALNNTITLYPNPTRDYFYITTTTPIENIKIHDSLGELVKKYKLQEVYSVKGLNEGIYFVYVESKEKRFVNKLVVEY